MESDDEVKGVKNSYDFGARILDPRVGRWLSRDPKESKYPHFSPYVQNGDNPIIYIDIDGRDIVFFDTEGNEVNRQKSTTEFKTYVEVGRENRVSNEDYIGPPSIEYKEVQMPGVIEGFEDPKYQTLDYQIAASTYLFNKKLASKEGLPATENHQVTDETKTPQFDVDLVKAMVIQESKGGQPGGNGTGDTDPMQSNYPGDWEASKDVKEAVGLEKNQEMNPATSINAGLAILYLKGMSSNTKGDYTSWKGDRKAVERYNGGGTAGYADSVMKYYNSAKPANPENYVAPKTSKKK